MKQTFVGHILTFQGVLISWFPRDGGDNFKVGPKTSKSWVDWCYPSSHNMEVENSPLGDKQHIFQDPIFHWTMIMGGRVTYLREIQVGLP